MWRNLLFIIILFFSVSAFSAEKNGWGWGGIPAINYNADDGFGYGAILNIFNYSDVGYEPYYIKLNPTFFMTTGGKQDHTLYFDSPYLLRNGWRFNIRLRYKNEEYFPYYGLGNDSEYNSSYIEVNDDDNSLDSLHGKHYYTQQSEQVKFIANFQKALVLRKNKKPLISLLIGYGFINVNNELNKNEGITTKVEEDINNNIITKKDFDGRFNSYAKFGLIYDTRDNEPAPNYGVWSEIVGELYSSVVGSETNFARITFTDRRYLQIFEKLVYANRIVIEKIIGDAPYSMYYPYGSSEKADEGLGGNRSLRGVLKNRYIGPEKFFINMELRYKFYDFNVFGQNFYIAANTFVDIGRVWHDDDKTGGFNNLHIGKGIGLHIGWNENFIAYADYGFGDEAEGQLYIDIGYLF